MLKARRGTIRRRLARMIIARYASVSFGRSNRVDAIEIWPRAAINFGRGVVGGDRIVMIEMIDHVSGQVVRIGFQHYAFVTFADHVAMVGEAVLGGSFFDDD